MPGSGVLFARWLLLPVGGKVLQKCTGVAAEGHGGQGVLR